MKTEVRSQWSGVRKALAAIVVVVVAVAALMMFQGCKESTAGKAYDAVYTASVTYDTAMQIAADQHKKGNISDEQKEEIIMQGQRVYNAIEAAQKALKIYKQAEIKNEQEDLSKAEKALFIAVEAMNEGKGVLLKLVE